MSEQNILNPSTTSPLNPDYSVKLTDPQIVARWQARSGKPYFRRLAARGLVWDLTWGKRMFADYQTLRQWFYQYENDYFTFADYDQNPTRYYTGMFADQPTHSRDANNQVTINAQFVVVPTLPMFQYPSNWNADAIFLEERTGFGDLVKLTGSNWDHRDKNYLLWSQDFENAVWSIGGGLVVTADNATAPDGTTTADKITGGGSTSSSVIQSVGTLAAEFYVLSIFALAGTSSQIAIGLWDNTANAFITVTPTIVSGPGSTSNTGQVLVSGLSSSSWTRVQLATNAPLPAGHSFLVFVYSDGAAVSTKTNFIWGSQLEIARAATTYTATTSAAVVLSAPASNSNYHGGSAYFDVGTNVADAAEWLYFGYGFQLWSPKGPDMGIVKVSLDGVVFGTVDLYAAALTASAVVWTQTNVALGVHRVKLNPTDTKNAASAGFYVSADALQVMR